jgi:hypothetical protein
MLLAMCSLQLSGGNVSGLYWRLQQAAQQAQLQPLMCPHVLLRIQAKRHNTNLPVIKQPKPFH